MPGDNDNASDATAAAMKDALESRIGTRLSADSQVLPRMVMRAAAVLTATLLCASRACLFAEGPSRNMARQFGALLLSQNLLHVSRRTTTNMQVKVLYEVLYRFLSQLLFVFP